MRLTLRRTAIGLTAAALLTACGGDDGGDSAASSSAATSSAAETSASETSAAGEAPEAGSEFCTQAEALPEQLNGLFADQADPAAVQSALQEAVERVRAIEPPAEIADSWTALADGLESLGTAFADVDQQDPQSLAEFEQRASEIQGELTSSSAEVQTYLAEQCGIDVGATESAAPSS